MDHRGQKIDLSLSAYTYFQVMQIYLRQDRTMYLKRLRLNLEKKFMED